MGFMRKLVFLRRGSQIIFLGLFIYILWSTTYPLSGGIPPGVLFKLDPLLMLSTALSERAFIPGLVFALLMTVATFFLGRFFCGWMCPLGTVIDFFGSFRKKPWGPTYPQNQRLKSIKYLFLGVFFLLAVAGVQAAWVMDPIVTAARVVSFNLIPSATYAVDRGFIWLIQKFGLYGGFYDFYRDLKAGFLGVRIAFFANAFVTFVYFLAIGFASFVVARLWCRLLCPLGAFYSLVASFSRLERKAEACNGCGLCGRRCRMGAINKEGEYDKGECILCMDCVYDCPEGKTRFVFRGVKEAALAAPRTEEKGMTRRSFLWLMASSLLSLGARGVPAANRPTVIRPPGVEEENRFLNTCVRCGNCMKVCVTNGLQPVMLESGWQGLWTPRLVPEIGYCEYNCNLCGQVCPTGAIPRLSREEKKQARLGLARVDRALCLAWAHNKQCIVCEEHCPVADKAIKLDIARIDGHDVYRPVVDAALCVGCGICQNKCPVSLQRAIRVEAAV